MSTFLCIPKTNLPATPSVALTESTIDLMVATDPVVVISLNEELSITKLISPASSPAWAPSEVLLERNNISVPVELSIFDFTSNALIGFSLSPKPIPTRGSSLLP